MIKQNNNNTRKHKACPVPLFLATPPDPAQSLPPTQASAGFPSRT